MPHIWVGVERIEDKWKYHSENLSVANSWRRKKKRRRRYRRRRTRMKRSLKRRMEEGDIFSVIFKGLIS